MQHNYKVKYHTSSPDGLFYYGGAYGAVEAGVGTLSYASSDLIPKAEFASLIKRMDAAFSAIIDFRRD